ncbi:hypothetical protein [Nocardia australiensis]|nr:hypothetical protein [Nocardia australiensis]
MGLPGKLRDLAVILAPIAAADPRIPLGFHRSRRRHVSRKTGSIG